LIEGSFPAQDRFEEGEEKSFGRKFARSMNDQGTLNCQGVESREECGGAVGRLVTAKFVKHNKPADWLAASRKSGDFLSLFHFHSVSCAKI